MRALPCRFVRPSLLLCIPVITAILTACGGGGGAGGGSGSAAPVADRPPQAAAASTALPLTAANAPDAAAASFAYGALALTVGQLAVDWTGQAESSPTRSFAIACTDGGSANGTLADRDGDGRAGAGDQVTVTLTGCRVQSLGETIDGSMTITLAAPAAGQQRAGVIAFSSFKAREGSPRQELTGALRFDYAAGRLSKLLHVASDTQPFGVRWTDGTATATDTLTAFDAQHETRVDTVRTTTSMRYSLASELLRGAVTVTTATPWTSWFDTYPDAGALEVAGANGTRVTLNVRDGGGSAGVSVGDTFVRALSFEGPDDLWAGDAWLPDATVNHYNVVPTWDSRFRLLRQPDPASLRPNATLTWLYSRPLDAASIAGAAFVQTNGALPDGPAVPATVKVEGGLLTIVPVTQLQPGTAYALRLSARGTSLNDTTGAALELPTFAGTVARTVSASLRPAAPPVLLGRDASLVLDAGTSSANGAPVASMRWRQLSGPALAFSDTGAARVTVTPATATNGTAVVELQVANAAGDIDSKTIDITVAADLTQSLVIAYRPGGAPLTVATNADPGFAGGHARLYQDTNTLDILLGTLRFMVTPRAALTWRTGVSLTYSKDGVSTDAAPGWLSCFASNHIGTLSIRDYALDAAGNLDRLALDFDDQCGTLVTSGSIRYHSAIPVPT